MGLSKLNPLETEMMRLLCEIHAFLDQRHVSQLEYTDMKGRLTQFIKKVDNIAAGCPTGEHGCGEVCERRHNRKAA